LDHSAYAAPSGETTMRFLYMDDRSGSAFTWLGRRELVGRKGDQHDELVAARDQMERLVRAIVEIGSDLDLDVTIHRIVNAAIELAGARYGALGIRGSDGLGLVRPRGN
jgi:hypothetical protein